ncbi:MAG: HD domain-containing protein [Thermoanaerobaculia bacterium]
MAKELHEFRDPVHTFIVVSADERRVIDSRPFQRLRHIHQLALTWLVYPGATHKRFEHCLGVMELAGRVFDVITRIENRRSTGRLTDIFITADPHDDKHRYWRQVVRLGALCHDLGHIPFSHGAESLLPEGHHHENLSLAVIRSPQMRELFERFPVRPDDVAKVAVGPSKWKETTFSPWEELMSDIVTGDAFGVDRIDYLLRDSIHTGVAYGRFDHHRLIESLRILWDDEQQKAVIGIERGAIHAAEAMQLARYYMFEQLYYHRVRRALDMHLKEYLRLFLDGSYPTDVEGHLALTDDHVLAAMQDDQANPASHGHDVAKRILGRKFFRILYERRQEDLDTNLQAVELVHAAAVEKFGKDLVKQDSNVDPTLPSSAIGKPFRFAVERDDGTVVSSLQLSQILNRLPKAVYDDVFVAPEIAADAQVWLRENLRDILGAREES